MHTDNIIQLREQYAYNGMPVIVSGERERLPDFKGLGGDRREAPKADEADKTEADSQHHLPADTMSAPSHAWPSDTLPAAAPAHPGDTARQQKAGEE